jgi:NAD(P)-dependent dehydrogenase (short-subunit alcohol dehydrogenase family)
MSGFDVVVTGRTVVQGDVSDHSPTVKRSDLEPLPGNLEATAAEITELGRRAVAVKLDLLERDEIEHVVEVTLSELGRIDVLVNNARYVGPGNQDLFVDTPLELFDRQFQCNVLAPLQLIKLVQPRMADGGGGTIVNVTSYAGQAETAALPGEGGWGLAYSMTKAALSRMTVGLAKELKQFGIAVINLEPGYVATERNLQDMAKFGHDMSDGLSPALPGSVCAALATHPAPLVFSGTTVDAPLFAIEHGLVEAGMLPPRYGPPVWGLPRRLPHEW